MAGVVHSKRSTSGRKQWTLHDGPRCSLKRLRSQLASDGCPESQVVLAKQLLEEQCEYEVDKKENARLGVYWLLKASEQGNTEATSLLKACLESGKGITEQNYMDVKSCITMTQDEKIARKAAREMFASLSNGEEYITSEQLQKKMLAIERSEKFDLSTTMHCDTATVHHQEREAANGELVNNYGGLAEEQSCESSDEEEDWTQRAEHNEKLTEDHLVSAAVHYAHGQLPLVNRILCLSEPNPRALDHIPVVQRPILHPLLALQILYYRLIKFLGRLSVGALLLLSTAKSDMQLLLLVCVYSFVSAESMVYFLPMVLYYATFFAMVLTTFQMLQTKREFYDFRLWSGLFITYSGGSVNAEQAEFQYIRNNLRPCWQFFMSLLVNLMLYPIIAEQYLLQSELTVVAFCLTFMTLFGFMYRRRSKIVYDGLVLFSFAINVLARYPYETDPVVTQGWRFIDLKVPTFASYVIGNGIEFCINFRALLYASVPVLLTRLAQRARWRGTHTHFLPHCVTLSWLQIVIISSQGATMFGLLRSTLALVGFVLFLPLVGLATVLLPAAAITKSILATTSGGNLAYALSLFSAFAAVGFLMCALLARTASHRKYTALLQLIFSAVSFYFLLSSLVKNSGSDLINSMHRQVDVRPLTYEQYQRFCHHRQQAWENENAAATQIRCAQLEGVAVNWDGYVHDVRVSSVTNVYRYFIDKLPSALSRYLYCFYGDPVRTGDGGAGDACDHSSNESNHNCRSFYEAVGSARKCSLHRHDVYTFKVIVRMQSGIWGNSEDVVVEAPNHFRNFSTALNANDHIWFRGTLESGLRGVDDSVGSSNPRPHVRLAEIGCLACHNVELTDAKVAPAPAAYDVRRLLTDLCSGVKCVVNFLLNPIIIFK